MIVSSSSPWLWPRLRRAAGLTLAAGLLASAGLAGSTASAGVSATGTSAASAAGPCFSVTGLQPPNPAAPGQTSFSSVSMRRDACDAWAVGTTITTSGDVAQIQHFDGSGWSVTENPDVAGVRNTGLHAVKVIAADSAWAVGSAGSGSLIEHWDGTAWHRVSSPAAEPAGSSLQAIVALSPSSIWAVGDTRDSGSSSDKTLIEHYDGTQWTVSQNVPSPGSSSALNAVTATDATDVWAVGNGPDGALVEHWNGSAWTVTPSPVQPGLVLRGVAATTAQNAWAVGYTPALLSFAPVVLHWDGRNWTRFTALPDGGKRLLAITTTGDTPLLNRNIWAVGDTSSGSPLAWRWDGSSWTAIPAPNLGDTSVFTGVTAGSANRVWLAGSSILNGAQAPLAISCC